GLDGDGGDARFMRELDGAFADGRKIDMERLAGLRCLAKDEMAASIGDESAVAVNAAALQKLVGAPDILGGDHPSTGYDQRLSQIERSGLAGGGEGEFRSAEQVALGGNRADDAFGREQVGDDLMHADE